MPASLSLDIPVNQLHKYKIARLGPTLSHKLALAVAAHTGKKSPGSATVEDLLHYLPMRYEDRSNLCRISDLQPGQEASLELYTKVAGGYQVKNKRSFGRSQLFIFEITAVDPERSGRPVVVWWFVSGSHARDIVAYYLKRFPRGSRFITFGKWEWDSRRATLSLRLHKPADELEMLPSPESAGTGDTETVADEETEQGSDGQPDDDESDPRLPRFMSGGVFRFTASSVTSNRNVSAKSFTECSLWFLTTLSRRPFRTIFVSGKG